MTMQKIIIWKLSQSSPVTILACTCIASLTNYSKVPKITGRLRKCWGYASQLSSTPENPKGTFFSGVETFQRSPCLTVKWLDWLHHHTVPQMESWYWLSSFLWSLHPLFLFTYKTLCKLKKVVMGLPWKSLIFCVIVACSFPFLPLLRESALLDHPSLASAYTD